MASRRSSMYGMDRPRPAASRSPAKPVELHDGSSGRDCRLVLPRCAAQGHSPSSKTLRAPPGVVTTGRVVSSIELRTGYGSGCFPGTPRTHTPADRLPRPDPDRAQSRSAFDVWSDHPSHSRPNTSTAHSDRHSPGARQLQMPLEGPLQLRTPFHLVEVVSWTKSAAVSDASVW
jgi:hypothetical protein